MRSRNRNQRLIAEAQSLVPVDVTALAESLGVAVWESPFLEKGVSGKLLRDRRHGGASGYSILVNSAEPYARKRFTVAHEIAHFLLHLDRVGDGVTEDAWFRSSFPLAEEREANRLAAELLMPPGQIERLVREGVTDCDELADKFHVSGPAMRIQLGQRGFARKR
ncbi:MAG: ImmA/IrrE family metallo-endopeptidase [Bryobacteraceae bacterium]